jgi:hypothetical protein
VSKVQSSQYKTIGNSEEVEDDSIKKSKKGKGERGRMSLLIRTLKAIKREKFPLF